MAFNLNKINAREILTKFGNITSFDKAVLPIERMIYYITKRHLNLLEHQSYTLLNQFSIETLKFGIAKSANEAKEVYKKLQLKDCVIKAQVLSGGRKLGKFKNSKIPGVEMVHSENEVVDVVGKMIGDRLITKQTGAAGLPCNLVMITEMRKPVQEFYVSIMMDRKFNGPAAICSAQGGTSIEDVAKKNPEAIIMEPVDIKEGMTDAKAKTICQKLTLTGKAADTTGQTLVKLFKMFVAKDATLLELNPFVKDDKGNFYTLDAKFRFDDSASYRQKELFALQDLTQVNKIEFEANRRNINYIQLDGQIGCVVNGAGLAMATMDIIKLHGGDPANFLDVGGSAEVENTRFAISTVLQDKNVKSILVNIFGGIMRCDIIAKGLILSFKDMKNVVPIVCRLLGTKNEEAKVLIKESQVPIISIDDFDEAAKKVVELAGSGGGKDDLLKCKKKW